VSNLFGSLGFVKTFGTATIVGVLKTDGIFGTATTVGILKTDGTFGTAITVGVLKTDGTVGVSNLAIIWVNLSIANLSLSEAFIIIKYCVKLVGLCD
jgi:hypothetical protein